MGRDCRNRYLTCASLGHVFQSDVLRLEFPEHVKRMMEDKNQWITLLYAILEGASDALGIARDDINGCMDYGGDAPAIILFDETPGGAGHVRRIFDKLEAVLLAAYRRVDGHCNCGEETACYGCLRSYSNQLDHEVLARGLARDYLEWLLTETTSSQKESASPVGNQVTRTPLDAQWKEALQEIMSTGHEESFQIARNIYVQGAIPTPDSIGYEIRPAGSSSIHEAALAWTEDKVALILQDDAESLKEAETAFQDMGWTTFTRESSISDLTDILKSC